MYIVGTVVVSSVRLPCRHRTAIDTKFTPAFGSLTTSAGSRTAVKSLSVSVEAAGWMVSGWGGGSTMNEKVAVDVTGIVCGGTLLLDAVMVRVCTPAAPCGQ